MKTKLRFFGKFILNLMMMLNLSVLAVSHASSAEPPAKIAFLLDDLRLDRWQRDRDFFTVRAKELGAKVSVRSANGDVELQKEQFKRMIERQVDVIAIIVTNSKAFTEEVKEAKAKGIKVISYDRLIRDADIDLYISFDNVKVGALQAGALIEIKNRGSYFLLGGSPTDNNSHLLRKGQLDMLNPLIKKKNIKIVGDGWAEGWSEDEAYRIISEALAKNTKMDAIVASNDMTANGALRALNKYGLAGKVLLSGQDADLAAIRRIARGTQSMTVYKPIKPLAYRGAEYAVALAKGDSIETNGHLENGYKSVPAFLLDPIIVDKSNLDETVFADGFHNRREVFGELK